MTKVLQCNLNVIKYYGEKKENIQTFEPPRWWQNCREEAPNNPSLTQDSSQYRLAAMNRFSLQTTSCGCRSDYSPNHAGHRLSMSPNDTTCTPF